MHYTVNAASRLVESATWFDSLSDFQKKEYIKEHPDSKYASGYHPSSDKEGSGDDVELEGDEHEAVDVETLGSKVRSWLVTALGGEPKRLYRTKNGLLKKAYFDSDDGGPQREVGLKYSQAMLDSGKKFSKYGYWKDNDTYVYLTPGEFRALTPEQKRSVDDRARAYGIGSKDSKKAKKSNVDRYSNFHQPKVKK